MGPASAPLPCRTTRIRQLRARPAGRLLSNDRRPGVDVGSGTALCANDRGEIIGVTSKNLLGESQSEAGLARSAPPHLCDDGVRDVKRGLSAESGCEEFLRGAFSAIDRDQESDVEYQRR